MDGHNDLPWQIFGQFKNQLDRFDLLTYASRAVQLNPGGGSIRVSWGGGNPISSGSPRVRPVWMNRTCGEPDETKENTHPDTYHRSFS